ncbi:MAG: CDP-archaeol synthase [Thiotrichales bacterium]
MECRLLVLIVACNGAPVVTARLLGHRFARPIDGGRRWPDGRAILGHSKTWRGILVALAVTTLGAPVLGFTLQTGLILGAISMLGDLLSSFAKRRLGYPPSAQALGIDQIPETLLPLIALKESLDLTWLQVIIVVIGFFVIERLLLRARGC